MKKGQQAQIFGIIIGIIFISGIMIFGYTSFSNLKSSSDDAKLIQFQQELQSVVKKSYSNYGSVKQFKSVLPPGFDDICFVQLDMSPNLITDNNFIQQSVADGAGENTFLIGKSMKPFRLGTEEISYIKNSDKPYNCIKSIDGYIELRVKGVGRGVSITQWNS